MQGNRVYDKTIIYWQILKYYYNTKISICFDIPKQVSVG